MVLGGKVNKSLVALIQQAGGQAIGLSGKDGGLLTAKVVSHMGRGKQGCVQEGVEGKRKYMWTGPVHVINAFVTIDDLHAPVNVNMLMYECFLESIWQSLCNTVTDVSGASRDCFTMTDPRRISAANYVCLAFVSCTGPGRQVGISG